MANDILVFADDAGANVLTQVEYAADTQRTIGNQAGIARSSFVNKVLRQTSFIAASLAQLIVDRTGQSVLDDGDDATLLANMKNATDVAYNINSATAKTTPVDADLVGLVDSAASNVLKKLSLANLKATLKTYFDTLYANKSNDLKILQTQTFQTPTLATGTTTVPHDNTLPQITEGTQFLSLAVTPTVVGSKLIIFVELQTSLSIIGYTIVSLYDGGADAIASVEQYDTTTSVPHPMTLKRVYTTASLTPITFTVRAGGSAASTITVNGENGASILGGALVSSIIIMEVI